jgi:nucleolar GTP-binding protein
VQGFPSFDQLDAFTTAMTHTVIDRDKVKQALGRINGAQRTIRRIGHLPKKEFLGRLKSMLKKLDSSLILLAEARVVLRRIPDPTIGFSVCLAGFPNAGKSTLLKALTGANAQIAAYEFTTKTLNYGTTEIRHHDVQFVDTPGTLNREKINPIERQAQLALQHLAKAIVFVYDPLREDESQAKLFDTMSKYGVPLAVYASKQDLHQKLPTFAVRTPVFTSETQIRSWLEPLVVASGKLESAPGEK